MAVGGVGGHLAWACAWRDGDGVSLDLRHFAIALRLASRRPAHTGHSVDTTAFVEKNGGLCSPTVDNRLSSSSQTVRRQRNSRNPISGFFSFLLKSGPVHTPTTAGGGGGGGRSESACPRYGTLLDFCCLEMRPDIIVRTFLPPAVGFCGLKKIANSKTWRVK